MDRRLIIIRNILWNVNIPPSYLGAHYLAYAALLVLQDQNRLTMVTKWLYPEVAAHFHTSWKSVERNIRTVIAICWSQDRGCGLARTLGCPLAEKPSPTNLIQLLAHHLLSQPDEFWSSAEPSSQMCLWQDSL